VSAAAWMGGFNATEMPDEQIRAFRSYLYTKLPEQGTPSTVGVFNYLHSISDYAYAVPPGRTEEEQVVTYVGSVKDISRSFKHVCELLGVRREHCVDPNDPRVGQHKISSGGLKVSADGKQLPTHRVRTVDLFDDELRGRVARIWAKDIERFGFVYGEL